MGIGSGRRIRGAPWLVTRFSLRLWGRLDQVNPALSTAYSEKRLRVLGTPYCQVGSFTPNGAIGGSLFSETASIQSYSVSISGRIITLVDTPGFNDTFRGETDVLRDWAPRKSILSY